MSSHLCHVDGCKQQLNFWMIFGRRVALTRGQPIGLHSWLPVGLHILFFPSTLRAPARLFRKNIPCLRQGTGTDQQRLSACVPPPSFNVCSVFSLPPRYTFSWILTTCYSRG